MQKMRGRKSVAFGKYQQVRDNDIYYIKNKIECKHMYCHHETERKCSQENSTTKPI